MLKSKIIEAKKAVGYIKDGSTVATNGFIGTAFPEELAVEIEKSFLETGHPKDLTLIYGAGQGDKKNKGLNHFGHEGLLKCVIGGHWGLVPKVQKLAMDNKIFAYNLPQGVISHMFRDIAAKKPGTITHVGLNTFVDPRSEGGRINEMTKLDIVDLININDQEYLLYKYMPIDVALVRGTTADTNGNISMEREALTVEILSVCQAARNSGGIIIAQVENIVENGSLDPKQVVVPGIFVDFVVRTTDPLFHMQTFSETYNSSYCGKHGDAGFEYTTAGSLERLIICRRASRELTEGSVINLGIGMPEGIVDVISDQQIMEDIKITVESGPVGGMPAGGLSFGCSRFPEAVIDQPYQFDFYQGNGLDIAFLGLAQADACGNVNVSKFGSTIAGCGGFIDITQNSKKVIYCGTFTAGGTVIDFESGKIKILKEGKIKKFIKKVEQITFNGKYSVKKGQEVMFITERAVFELTANGLELIETAPGIDVKKDILDNMEFTPLISNKLKNMEGISTEV